MDLTYRIVRRLFRDTDASLSRNRNFAAYEDATVQRAARIFRHLRSVEQDLLAIERGGIKLARVSRDEATGLVVELEFEDGKARRTSMLTEQEWALLLENSAVSELLVSLLEELPEAERAMLEDALAILASEDREEGAT